MFLDNMHKMFFLFQAILFVDNSSYSWCEFWKTACWAWDSQLKDEATPRPFSLSVQSVDCATELINTYLMLYTALWAMGSMSPRCKRITWHISPLLPCSSVSPLIQEEILINYTTTDSCFCLLLGMSDSVISLTDERTLQFSK